MEPCPEPRSGGRGCFFKAFSENRTISEQTHQVFFSMELQMDFTNELTQEGMCNICLVPFGIANVGKTICART